MTAPAARPRDDALDALRGVAIVGMVLVNLQGSDAHVFPILAHAPWDGLTIADLVFPLFLLCLGLSLPLAIDGREPRVGVGRIARRSILLYLIGFSIGWIVHASTHLIDIRFTGVLARIGIVYLACALTTRATTGWRVPALAGVALMAVHGLLLYAAPSGGVASMAAGEGFSGWLDRAMLGGTRLYGKVFDPEGPLSTLSAIATAMIGLAAQRLAMRSNNATRMIFAIGAICFVGWCAAQFLWPVNKALWTPSFALINAAIGLGLLAGLKFFWPMIGAAAPVRLMTRMGGLALTLYVVHALLTALLVIPVDGERLWALSFGTLARLGLPLDWTSLLYAVIAGALSIVITLALAKRGWVLRV
ncbi:MAG: heparan-alpha-glucosaminide N-acetyltransferase domain-containing protein [Sphingomonas sp.]